MEEACLGGGLRAGPPLLYDHRLVPACLWASPGARGRLCPIISEAPGRQVRLCPSQAWSRPRCHLRQATCPLTRHLPLCVWGLHYPGDGGTGGGLNGSVVETAWGRDQVWERSGKGWSLPLKLRLLWGWQEVCLQCPELSSVEKPWLWGWPDLGGPGPGPAQDSLCGSSHRGAVVNESD